MAKFVLGIILSIILLMSGLGYDVNYAEARGDDEPCSYRLPHSFLKISNDPWKCEKVDYWVPEKCGIKAGLYKTDASCQPAPAAEPEPVPPKPAEPAPDPEPPLEREQMKEEVDAYCKANPGKCVSDSLQKSRDSMFSGIMAAIVILIIIGIGILFARKKLHGSFGGGGFAGGGSGGYDDGDEDMGRIVEDGPGVGHWETEADSTEEAERHWKRYAAKEQKKYRPFR